MTLTMTKEEREAFLADVHVAVISVAEDGHGPLLVPIWYSYEPGGEVRIITGRTSRKGELLERAGRFSLCVQTETLPYKYVSVEGPIVAVELGDGGFTTWTQQLMGNAKERCLVTCVATERLATARDTRRPSDMDTRSHPQTSTGRES
jgi:hypothetical protein